MAKQRQRDFATVVYPESAPADWVDILEATHVEAFISPLHDRDLSDNGEPKKPHYHVMLMFRSPKDFDRQVKPIFESIGAVGREKINSKRGYARYLCHLDNPDKAQYDKSELRALSGADYSTVITLPSDDVRVLKEIFAFIRKEKIYSLAELIDVCSDKNEDWFKMITMSKSYIIDKFIKSLTWERENGYVRASKRAGEADVISKAEYFANRARR